MIVDIFIFIAALTALIIAARFFTNAAEEMGKWLGFPSFVIGIFIVGIGTSLPELVSSILSVRQGVSEIVPGNIIGANISNLLLVTGFAVVINRKPISLGSTYIYIDLNFLIGCFFTFYIISYDGKITFNEAFIGLIIFVIYSIYLIKGGVNPREKSSTDVRTPFPLKGAIILLVAAVGVYFGANYTVSSIQSIATALGIPEAIIALTVLSLGTTLPELAVNITAIKQGKAEMAVGNVLGSCVFNTLVIPAVASTVGSITVPAVLISFSLPVMAGSGILFYLLTQDKRISVWEGLMFVMIYLLFMVKIATG
ncbi:sodium:calcium antiporter [Paraflavitalea soli]|uniref:Sodium:calcium antiporter n=1 Tax=Paraflavitalea soli TaxID=2315862 RepID=A0A3B7MU54_9BACT|nr:sodium:calcium antiporter [Paraflavitalea soli]AXY77628.1 sodium:calcium antiporter [Paraflavitalea soli]